MNKGQSLVQDWISEVQSLLGRDPQAESAGPKPRSASGLAAGNGAGGQPGEGDRGGRLLQISRVRLQFNSPATAT